MKNRFVVLRSVTWSDGVVSRLALAAYEERLLPSGLLDSGRLAVLADALDEAGCADANLLGHLRGRQPCSWCLGQGAGVEMFHDIAQRVEECSNCGGTGWTPLEAGHVRGCFGLDLLLRKEQSVR